jgi:hypothetical protein
MNLRLAHGLAYVEVTLTYRDRDLLLRDVILDTGSAGTVFSADRLLEIGVAPEPQDALRRIRGVGGTEFVFTKVVDRLAAGEVVVDEVLIEVGALSYGFPADGILGLDYLIRAGAVLDLQRLELRASPPTPPAPPPPPAPA